MQRCSGINGCPARGARGDLNEPRVNAAAVKDVAARGEFPAPVTGAESVQTDNALGIG